MEFKTINQILAAHNFAGAEHHQGQGYYMFVKPNEGELMGCDFLIIEIVAYSSEKNFDSMEGEVTFWGHIYWDGLRHLYMGSEHTNNEGYLYYINPKEVKHYMNIIHTLELKYCKHDSLHYG